MKHRTVFSIYLMMPVLSFLVWASTSAATESTTWSGWAEYEGQNTRIELQITESEAGDRATLSLPDIGVSGWPANKVVLGRNSIEFTFPSDSGEQVIFFENKGGLATGYWSDARFEKDATVNLRLSNNEQSVNEETYLIDGIAGKIGVSIISPVDKPVTDLLVLTHSSGMTPRDVNRFAAKFFASNGIAVAIYDKRGIALSEGDYFGAAFEDHAADAVSVARYLANTYPKKKLGFWGHSQGGWIAPLAATQFEKTSFVITISGPMVPPAVEGEWGFVYNILGSKQEAEIVPKIKKFVKAWHDGLRQKGWDSFSQLRQRWRNEVWFEEAGLNYLSIEPNTHPTREYLLHMDYDPIPHVKSLAIPFLAIYSIDDESINVEETLDIIGAELSERDNIRVLTYSGYDHSMRLKGKGKKIRFPKHPEDYFEIQLAFVKSSKSRR